MAGSVTSFSARHATIKLSSTAITYDFATNLDDEAYGITILSAKDITISVPKSEVTQVPLLGQTGQTIGAGIIITGTFQNANLDESNWSNGKVSGTLILTGDEQFEALALGVGTATTGTELSTRYGFGDEASGKERVRVGALMVTVHNNVADASGEVVSFGMTKPIFNIGDIKPTSAEGGHWEIGFEAEALPQNCSMEFQN